MKITREDLKAVWVHEVIHKWTRKFAAELGISNRIFVEQAINDYVSRHPQLYQLFEDYINDLKENGLD